METCAICEREILSSNFREVISAKGIVKVCNNCYSEDMPLFVKPSEGDFDSIYKRKSVYSRLSDAAGLNSEEHKKRIMDSEKQRKNPQDDYLRSVSNRNFEARAKNVPKNENLIDNFNWIIMRTRRLKKLSRGQLAEAINEPESAIVLAEKGVIPAGNNLFVQKIEEFLRINISRELEKREMTPFEKVQKEYLERIKEEGDFDPFVTRNVTTSDLVLEGEKKKKKWRLFGRKKKTEEVELTEDDFEDLDFG